MTYRSVAVCLIIVAAASAVAFSQSRAGKGKVCGDPTVSCKTRDSFQEYELPFDHGKNFVIAESEAFYAVVLKSVKLAREQDCETAIDEKERLAVQELFPRKKVFVLRCFEPGLSYYTNVPEGVSFMAVFAGRTHSEANKVLAEIKAKQTYSGAYVKKMRTGINGT